MAERREYLVSLLLRYRGNKNGLKIELFDAEEWAEDVDLPTRGLVRARIGGRWFCPNGQEHCFLTVADLLEQLAETLQLALPPRWTLPVALPRGSRVRVILGEDVSHTVTWTSSQPFQRQGQWYVRLVGCGQQAMPLDKVEVLREA